MNKTFYAKNCHLNYQNDKYIQAIINLTPDSFSDGNKYKSIQEAIKLTLQAICDGASIIDVGGESTRPNAKTVPTEEEIARVIPFIKELRKRSSIPISIDTRKSLVAKAALAEGANIVNDVSGLKYDQDMGKVIAQNQAGCILMHMRGEPSNMQSLTQYNNLISDIIDELHQSINIAKAHNIKSQNIMLDPGIGFSKTTSQNLQILNQLEQLVALPYPILVGTSRKSFIGDVLQEPNPTQRLWGTSATLAIAALKGVSFFRVHDVRQMYQTIKVSNAILNN